ncbi:uncharacterized protein [Arachis hypogaea]|uniref:uncharacterized protein isoform X2 n=1 Tax=Arachis hypogaea TaxID=3818 RepID=UPI000DECFE16|nr:uncharacterized protein LOC112749643 isoform X2 [Arachis hypogaea]
MDNLDPNPIYDVFLSSEIEPDSNQSYTSCLCSCLQKAGISVFRDDDALPRNEDNHHISPSQLQAIQNSRISVVVLTEGYAGSERCLQVLEQILECHRIAGQFVLPVFLGLYLDAVRFQIGAFGRAFEDLTKRISDKDQVECWKIAFARICRIRPNHWTRTSYSNNSHVEVDFKETWSDNDKDIKEHVELVRGMLKRTDLFIAEYPMGAYRAYLVPLLLEPKPTGVVLLGIWGMVGIGKTTLAKSIYNQIGDNFEGKSFLPNIKHVWEQQTRRAYLQERLLMDICIPSERQVKIDSIENGKKKLKEILSHKKLLVVLDDVNKLEQLNALCGSRGWFGPGSMIIITTRDRGLLRNVDMMVGVDHVHEMKEMDENESFEIFNRCAFKSHGFDYRKDKRDISAFNTQAAVAYAGRLPLALEVLGSKIFTSFNLDSALDRCTESLHPVLKKVFKRHIDDDLIGTEKEIFLDAACFLNGMNRDEVVEALNAFGDFAKIGIRNLEDKCFVAFDHMNNLGMHVLLRDFGREILGEQIRVEPAPWLYDAVLSFTEDIPTTFISDLYTFLTSAGICVFMDCNHETRRVDRISLSLLQAIGRSRISIVVLSTQYANSRWCLQELEKIIECHRKIGQVVVPVFYGIDPSEVLNETGVFGRVVENLFKRFSVEGDMENRWRVAILEIGRIEGITIADFGNKCEDITKIVKHVTHHLDMFIVDHPVGVEARVQDLIQLLNCEKSKDVLLLGIWGMGGSGKTPIAKVTCNKLCRDYKGRGIFLQNISEVWKKDNGQVYLKEKLLSGIHETTQENNKSGGKKLMERLRNERVFVVLDDVDRLEQLNSLCGSREWFGPGSVIIITTRNKRLLNELGVDYVYQMKEMDKSESLMLFSWHAFKQPCPRDDFRALSRDVVAYCGGLPLALEVLGSELYGEREKVEWRRTLQGCKIIPHPTIYKVLKRSFDGLSDSRVENIFLEIACFYIGLDQNEVVQKLNNDFGDSAETVVAALVERCLVTVDKMNKIRMHVLLRNMGIEIFRQRQRMHPEQRIYDVFLSFSKDTPPSFISRLTDSMKKAGMSFYKNDDSLSGDDQISRSLLAVIQKSRIFIIVLSKNYARSTRCLQVLEQITGYRRIGGQFILPVFLDVDPKDLRLQREFTQAFRDLKENVLDKAAVDRWKIAFARIFQIRSFKFVYEAANGTNRSKDDDVALRVVERAKDLLDKRNLFIVEFPFQVDFHVTEATQLLTHRKSRGALLLGIWGMAGIGKTTIAKAIYNKIGGDFEGRSFLPGIREMWEFEKRHAYFQERILSDIFMLPKIKIDNVKIGKKLLKEKLSHRKVLLVFDDVNKLEQLNALCESHEWFGPRSVIIITTRDRALLRVHHVDHVYNIKEMDESKSLVLLIKILKGNFKIDSNTSSQKLVACAARGLPLALEILGSGVSSTSDMVNMSLESPHPIVRNVLERCINDLSCLQKSMFLDIACFLIGMDREEVIQALNVRRNLAEDGINTLEDQSLVTFDKQNKIRMNVLLQETARKIVHDNIQSKPQPWIYDVFLSFRGEDTRASFTSHLSTYLANAGFHVFMDDEKIRRGDWISISLLQAIKKSRIFVVVLSRRYSNSRWCLQELESIMVCSEANDRVILPVFYGVDPSTVRKQNGEFGEAFQDLLNRFSVDRYKEESWRKALRHIGGIAGIEIIGSRNESEDINRIVEHITGFLGKTFFFVAQHPVGVNSRVDHVVKLLNHRRSKDVEVLGISGIGGVGKTTIAKAIYNQIHRDFEACCCLLDIREKWKQITCQVDLQNQLLSDVYTTTKIKIRDIELGKTILKERLQHKRILLILDDVDDLSQLTALCGSRKWFGPGSRIIITTRDEGLLRILKVDHVSRMSEMDDDESIEHFSWHAFKKASPQEDFAQISRDVAAYCKGLPLALEVIGSLLFDKEIEEWQSVLEKLQIIPNRQVQKKLRISFDSLSDDTEKEIFLDIAFFFIGMDQNDVLHILDGANHPALGIKTLKDRCLVTIDNNNKLGMHDLLRDMGREIVREESIKEPEKRSRLWLQKDVLKVLQKHMGTRAVEGLALKLTRNNTVCFKTEAFKEMHRLRLLQLASVQLDGNFEYLSQELRWLNWHDFPLKYMPPNFYQEGLAAIELESSCLTQLWTEDKLLVKLKFLNLSHSHHLTQIPNVSYMPNLEKLLLKDCPNLTVIPDTIGDLKKILLINLEDCTSLSNLPRSFYRLESLETLIISGCSKIDKLEEELEQMKSLVNLIANRTSITKVPYSIIRSKSVRYISICGYEGFSRDVFPSLIWNWMSPTNIISFSTLIQTSACPEFVPMDVIINLHSLRPSKNKQGVKRVLDILDAAYCKQVEAKRTASQKLTAGGPDDCLLSSDNYYSLTFNCEGSSVIFEVPHVNGGKLESMMLCIVFSSSLETEILKCLQEVLIKVYTETSIEVYNYKCNRKDRSAEFLDWQSLTSKLEPGTKVEVHVIPGVGFTVKKSEIYLVYNAAPTYFNMENCQADDMAIDENPNVSGDDNMATEIMDDAGSSGVEEEDYKPPKKRRLFRV